MLNYEISGKFTISITMQFASAILLSSAGNSLRTVQSADLEISVDLSARVQSPYSAHL